jgi:dihydrofolate synthase/folylpolyglutamate synthase
MKNLNQWLDYQLTLNNKEIDLSLDRLIEVKERLNFTQPDIKIFLVAGTNGKGTTCHLIQELLINKGLNVGTYTSPHLIDYNERVKFNDQNIDDSSLIESFEVIEKLRNDIPLTYFEYGTLGAFIALSSKPCDAWVIEVGLGGRLDATNILNPSVAVITSISMDHQDWLGDDIESIAREKAGIIKGGAPCVSSAKNVSAVIRDFANKHNACLYEINDDYSILKSKEGYIWDFNNIQIYQDISIPNHWGEGEITNLSTSLAAIHVSEKSLLPSIEELNLIISEFSLPGRFHIINEEIPWILDVAHNYESAVNFLQRLDSHEISGDILMIFGMMRDKDIENYIKILKNRVKDWIATGLDSSRASSAAEISEFLNGENISNVIKANNPAEAIDEAKKVSHNYDAVIVSGSFELVGPALHCLQEKS